MRNAFGLRTNGTSLREKALQTPPEIEKNQRKCAKAFDTPLANTALLIHVQESPLSGSVSARLARYQLYRDSVAAIGSFPAVLAVARTGPCHAAPAGSRIGGHNREVKRHHGDSDLI